MAQYEHVFLARQDLSQAQVDGLAEAATKIVEENDGKVTKTETWGLRTLAYKIQKNRKAHYVMLNIDSGGSTIAELERQTRINEDVLRFLTEAGHVFFQQGFRRGIAPRMRRSLNQRSNKGRLCPQREPRPPRSLFLHDCN